jgi:inorganic pyrophosphatase
MSLNNVTAGNDVPNNINVIIEISANSNPVKYEVMKDAGVLQVDRFLSTPMHYPCNYGYVPQTLCGDGDPVDVLVVTPFPLLSGSVIQCRPVGVLSMTDEAGVDNKVIAVPIDKLSRLYHNVKEVDDLPIVLLDSISHFFEHYKTLEKNKWVKVEKWLDREAAIKEITDSVAAFNSDA